jgi:hypothetical protein
MVNEPSPDDPIEIWQNQHVEPLMMTMEEVRNKAVRFERQIRIRNRRETIVALVMIVVFGLFLLVFRSPMQRAGSLLTIAGLVFVIYRMNRQAAPESVPSGGFESCVAFHRRELERQRDLLRSIGLWYLGPLIPGVVVFSVAIIEPKIRPDHPADWWRALPGLAIMVAWFWFTIRLNWRAAAGLQRTIDELTRVAEQ